MDFLLACLLREIIFSLALRLIRNLRLGVVRNLESINFTSSLRPSQSVRPSPEGP